MIFYGLSDLCMIHEGPNPLINMENYIPYESSILLLTKHLKILQDHTQLTHCEVKKGGQLYFHNQFENIKNLYLFIALGYIILYIFRTLS